MATIPTGAGAHSNHGAVDRHPDPEVPERARVRHFSADYKLRVLNEYESLDRQGKGTLLRREGLYTALISEWRKQRDKGALSALSQKRGRPEVDPRERENARLRRENQRLAEELEKAQHVIRVQGELSALLKSLASESAESESEHGR